MPLNTHSHFICIIRRTTTTPLIYFSLAPIYYGTAVLSIHFIFATPIGLDCIPRRLYDDSPVLFCPRGTKNHLHISTNVIDGRIYVLLFVYIPLFIVVLFMSVVVEIWCWTDVFFFFFFRHESWMRCNIYMMLLLCVFVFFLAHTFWGEIGIGSESGKTGTVAAKPISELP